MEDKKEFPKFTVLVPANHEIIVKPIPEKEYFSQKPSKLENHSDADLSFEQVRAEEREAVERYNEGLIDQLGTVLPPEMFLDLGKKYIEIRKKKCKKMRVEEGLLRITIGSKELLVGLHHILKTIRQNNTGAALAALKKSDQEIFKKYLIVKKVSNWAPVGISQEERQAIVQKAQARKDIKAATKILKERVDGPKNS
jgi:superfamily II DNA or RNA helicase